MTCPIAPVGACMPYLQGMRVVQDPGRARWRDQRTDHAAQSVRLIFERGTSESEPDICLRGTCPLRHRNPRPMVPDLDYTRYISLTGPFEGNLLILIQAAHHVSTATPCHRQWNGLHENGVSQLA